MKNVKSIISAASIALAMAFAPCFADGGTFTDSRDGKKYKMAKVGAQTWMAQNLNYEASGSKCYNNNPANCEKYGRLYDWETSMKICPAGWHLPSNAEWDKLYRSADGSGGTGSLYKSASAGKLLKTTSGWNDYGGIPGDGTDKFGFAAMPGGYSSPIGSFGYLGLCGIWWSTSENEDGYAYYWYMGYDTDGTNWGYYEKTYYHSVRCLKN